MPRQYHPTPEERDERVSVPLPPELVIEGILAAGPHPDETELETTKPPEDGEVCQ